MAQIESVVEPNSVADDIGSESVTLVRVHPQIINQWQLTCQYCFAVAWLFIYIRFRIFYVQTKILMVSSIPLSDA